MAESGAKPGPSVIAIALPVGMTDIDSDFSEPLVVFLCVFAVNMP